MKLAIGVNLFGSNKRQSIAAEVLCAHAKHFTDIELFNITFKNEKNTNSQFTHLPLIRRTAADVIKDSISQKPIAKDFFDILSQQDCDAFLFLNSDILLTRKAIKLIMEQAYETYSFSRADCYEFDEPTKAVPFRIEIAGFDGWAVNKNWWIANRDLFDDYVYAEHLWDVAFAITMFKHSNSKLCNKDIYIAHEKHPLNWNENSVEALHNSSLWKKTEFHQKWHDFVFTQLIKRTPHGQFFVPLSNEEESELRLFK